MPFNEEARLSQGRARPIEVMGLFGQRINPLRLTGVFK
jgi:hypothetical protein